MNTFQKGRHCLREWMGGPLAECLPGRGTEGGPPPRPQPPVAPPGPDQGLSVRALGLNRGRGGSYCTPPPRQHGRGSGPPPSPLLPTRLIPWTWRPSPSGGRPGRRSRRGWSTTPEGRLGSGPSRNRAFSLPGSASNQACNFLPKWTPTS